MTPKEDGVSNWKDTKHKTDPVARTVRSHRVHDRHNNIISKLCECITIIIIIIIIMVSFVS